jgi:hypothetical protein
MARIVPFASTLRSGQREGTRYPRFEEVSSQIDVIADELFDAPNTLAAGRQLFLQLQGMISPEALAVLNQLYETLLTHEEKFEHAAYLVGLQAATGGVKVPAPLLNERRADAGSDPQGDPPI